MARQLRIEYPGAVYHVMNRGDRREPIFHEDRDREQFIEALGQACGKTGWQLHAWCLMPNHFHLVIETPDANLVAGMKWLLGTYTSRFNRRHNLSGHVFGGRYKSLVVERRGTGYLKSVCDYVHLNPVRAKLVTPRKALRGFRWSSYPLYLQPPSRRPAWLRVDRLFGEWNVSKDNAAGRREFEKSMETRRHEGDSDEWEAIRRGWCIGGAAFRQELLEQVEDRAGAHHAGAELRESTIARADRLVAQALARWNWTREDLGRARKSDGRKVRLARRLRAETTLTLKEIARRLDMGSSSNVAHCLGHSSENK